MTLWALESGMTTPAQNRADEPRGVPPSLPDTVSVPEAARRLGISRTLAYELVSSWLHESDFERRRAATLLATYRVIDSAECASWRSLAGR